jgi:ABC-type sugar transport system substrate-binding protein
MPRPGNLWVMASGHGEESRARLDAIVFQGARGQANTALGTALRIVRKQAYEKQTYTPFQLVTKENVAQFLAPR